MEQVLKDSKVFRVLRVHRGFKVLQDLVLKDLKELKGFKVHKDLVFRVFKARKVFKDLLEERKVFKEQ